MTETTVADPDTKDHNNEVEQAREAMEAAGGMDEALKKVIDEMPAPARTEHMTITNHAIRISWDEFLSVLNKLDGINIPEDAQNFRMQAAYLPSGTLVEGAYTEHGDRYADGVIVTNDN